jgi:glycosyltransferase involved in cell wall biosynthesis
MPKFSLIVPTLGRTNELQHLFESLALQAPAQIELLIVDQNEDDRVLRLLPFVPAEVQVVHLRQPEKNVSMARNLGLLNATGDYVAFPDDDCWYPPQLLPKVVEWFGKNSKYQIFSSGAVDVDGISSGNRWFQSKCEIRPFNSLRTTFCNSLFMRRGELPPEVLFDVRLKHGEETDFVLRLLKEGCKGYFDSSLNVGHPRRDMLSGTVSQQRAMKYGEGMGRLVRSHSLGLLWFGLLTYDLARAAMVVLTGRFSTARFCIAHMQGLIKGFWFPASPQASAVPSTLGVHAGRE